MKQKGGILMQAGKLRPEVLHHLVFSQLERRRPEVMVTAALGEDCAFLQLEGDLCVISTDPITGAAARAGWLAVHISCNDVAAGGADPVAVLLTILLPVGTPSSTVQTIVADAEEAAAEVNVEIVGGHTEFTAAVNQPVISTTVIGRTAAARPLTNSLIQPGDALVATKYVGLEGTSIVAWDFPQAIEAPGGEALLSAARELSQLISVVPEARLAVSRGVRSMHDATEGGVLGAIFEMAAGAELGFVVYEDQLVLHPATRLLAAEYGIDPLRLISSGTLLIATPDPQPLVADLVGAGIPASVVGKFEPGPERYLLRSDGSREAVQPPEGDELWRLIDILSR